MTTSDWHVLIGVGLFWGALLLFVVMPWLIKRRSDPKLVKDNIMIYLQNCQFLLGIGVSLIHDVDMSLSYNRDQISMMKRAMDNDDRDSDK